MLAEVSSLHRSESSQGTNHTFVDFLEPNSRFIGPIRNDVFALSLVVFGVHDTAFWHG